MGVMKAVIIKIVAIALAICVTIGAVIGLFTVFSASASSFVGDYSSYSDLGSYTVKIDESGAMPPLTKKQLKTAIEGGGFTEKMTQHYIDWMDAVLGVQSKYKINAVFCIAIIQVEHGGGGPDGDINWGSIPSSSYNIVSIKSNSGGWVNYSSYEDAIINGLGKLLYDNYLSEGRYTITDIGNKYCPPQADENQGRRRWDDMVKEHVDKMYAAAGVQIPMTGSATGQKIVKKAEEIMQYMINNKYVYAWGNKVPLKANGKQCDCSTFVCWVLYDLGITDCQNNGSQLTTYTMDTNGEGYFKNHGWTKVKSYNDLQPGDIVIMSGGGNANGHVQIFAYKKNGQNYYINCGWSPCDHTSVYETYETTFYSAWRIPK